MIQSNFHKFSVKIIHKPFYSENGNSYPSIALVTFYDNHGDIMSTHDFGSMSTDDIYDMIERDEVVNLDHCYVRNFSFTAYRRIHLMDKKQVVKLKSISAKGAFFHSKYVVDFSYLEIGEGGACFNETCFSSTDLLFANTNFGEGVTDFSNVLFRTDKNDFSNSIFNGGDVLFKNSIFTEGFKNFQYTDFHFSTFAKGDISFERTDFGNGSVDFKAVSFDKGKVNFNRAVFGEGDILFDGSSAEGRITFKKTSFGKGALSFELAEYDTTEIDFEKASFEDSKLSFFNGYFSRLVLKGCHFDNYLDMRVRKCSEIDLSDTVVRDIVDFKQYEFNVEIDVLNIAAMRLLGVIYINWDNNSVHKLIDNQPYTSISEKAEQYRILKESFNTTGQYADEDKSYVLFSRYQMRAEYDKSISNSTWTAIYKKPIYLFNKLVFDYVGLFATAPLRVLFSMLVTYIAFSLIFSLVLVIDAGDIVSGIGGEHSFLGVVGRSFYHSGITFFTIGYGDFYPLGAMRWLSQVEGFVGVFLMSYFTVAFVHKVLR